MISFQQTAESFLVTEQLLYELSGMGKYVFVKIRKRNLTTRDIKQKLSEQTGVPFKMIHHAGMKDKAATAIQWLSWPRDRQRAEAVSKGEMEILEQTAHENALGIGHVAGNQFRLILEADQPIDEERARAAFPNFYGRQRFGRFRLKQDLATHLEKTQKNRDDISSLQGRLFNELLRQRLAAGTEVTDDELWTGSNGKRCFNAALDDELMARFRVGEISPTGAVFGYKMQYRDVETAFLGSLGIDSEHFRKWGKFARGARRALFVKPGDVAVSELEEGRVGLSFSLPAGCYATVYLTHLFKPELFATGEAEWPDFQEPVVLA